MQVYIFIIKPLRTVLLCSLHITLKAELFNMSNGGITTFLYLWALDHVLEYQEYFSPHLHTANVIVLVYCIFIFYRTKSSVRTILPAMKYLHRQLTTVLKELKKIEYRLGPVATCSHCNEEQLLTYIIFSSDKGSNYSQCKCTGCRNDNLIDHSNKVILSQVRLYYAFC